jgi:hypothetical protein
MKEPTFDRDGYPTEETLEAIEKWPVETIKEVFPFIAAAWYYPDCAREMRSGLWVFATGGWSGNESLMRAFEKNICSFSIGFYSLYVPGGLWIFALESEAKDEFGELCHYITKWAWKERS